MSSKLEQLAPVDKCQLLVVGAGPVGLFAALCGVRRGLQVVVVERNFRSQARGYATLLHPSSLRLLVESGLGKRLLAAGTAFERVELYIDGEHVKELELPSAGLTIAQSVFEELLLKELRDEAAVFRAPCVAEDIVQSHDKVSVRVVRRELASVADAAHESSWQPVETRRIEADFVIGADGYDSSVRAALGISCGDLNETQTFAVFEGPSTSPQREVELAFDSGLASAAYPLPENRARCCFQLSDHFSDAPDIERLRGLLDERRSFRDVAPSRVEWSAVTHFERRLVERFGKGRIWLAGDAAHVTSPFGGQSMNGGLREVHGFVELMADHLLAGKSLARLEQLGARHERDWQQLVVGHVALETLPNAPARVRDNARRIVPALPVSGADLHHVSRQLGIVLG